MTCGVFIATHNRKEDLEHTCEVLANLRPLPDEILICADGCTDGTCEFIATQFPTVRLLVNDTPVGSVTSRDLMLRHAKSDILISLDDDSHPVETDFVERVRQLFTARPRLAIAAFPQQTDEFPETLGQTDFGPNLESGTYAASAAAFRREIYLKLEGWDIEFGHAYEEPDYALQCIAAGFEVLYYTNATVRHHYSAANRNEIAIHHRHARNEQWSVWRRCPLPYAFVVAAFRAARQLQYAAHRGADWVVREPVWWLEAVSGLPRCLATRKPVRWSAYRKWMYLIKAPQPDEP